MTCEKPGINPIDDSCCFDCFTIDRGPYNVPIAVVLHEVDEHLESLNNRLENCCGDSAECHQSFHYGVGEDGTIINWVDPANTAWSFDPLNSDQNCGTCGWSIATQEGINVDPNLYTVNIAVATGVVGTQSQSLTQNNYSEKQYKSLVRLTGWLAETFGIAINQNTIWRHCDELDDFPAGCCSDGSCETYSDFLEDVQACIDATNEFLPWLCDALCDAELQAGTPTFIIGSDPSCDSCGRYQLEAVMTTNFCDVMLAAVTDTGMLLQPGTVLLSTDCNTYLMPDLCELMNDTTIAVGDPIVDNTITVLGSDCQFHAIDQLANFDLCTEITGAYTNDAGDAVPGVTNLLGLDCNYYQLPAAPDFCSLLFDATGAYDDSLNWVMLQRNDVGDVCQAVLVDDGCGEDGFVSAALGVNDTGPLMGRLRPSLPNRTVNTNDVAAPESDGVVYVDGSGGNVTVTLTPPGDCDPNLFYFKRTDAAGGNTVTIDGGANTIDGAASITLDITFPLNSACLYWNGSNWTRH